MHDMLMIRRIDYQYSDIPLRRGSGETTVRVDKETAGQSTGRTTEQLIVLPDKWTDNRITSRMIGQTTKRLND